jgi:uncharacterized alkaline shock family protein YloU
MTAEAQLSGIIRVARQVLSTIVIDTTLQIPGVIRMAHTNDQWSRLLSREIPRQRVELTVKDNTVSADLYIVVSANSNISEVATTVQEEVASAIELMIGMHVHAVNVYIQDIV